MRVASTGDVKERRMIWRRPERAESDVDTADSTDLAPKSGESSRNAGDELVDGGAILILDRLTGLSCHGLV